MNRVYLCEKPSQGRDIARVLACTQRSDGYLSDGNGTSVTWCIGHLLEQAPPEDYDPNLKAWRLDTIPFVPTEWKYRVVKRQGYSKQLRTITGLLKRADEVVIACDAGREGEAIGREVLEHVHYRGPIKRLWLSAFVDQAIRNALDDLKDGAETLPLYRAAIARARADWIVGLNLTRLYTLMARARNVDRLLSVGRVQSPTLAMIVERDRTIEAFVPTDFFVVQAECLGTGNCHFSCEWQPSPDAKFVDAEGRCTNEYAARTLAQLVTSTQGRVAQCDVSKKSEGPPLPFSLSALQQAASARYGLRAEGTLNAAQALYEKHKLTTYPRTDSSYLNMDLRTETALTFAAMIGTDPSIKSIVDAADPALQSRAWNDSKVSDHHAIIPTSAPSNNLSSLSEDEIHVYDMIRRRYLAQFYPKYAYEQISLDVDFDVTHQEFGRERFRATGRRVLELGWRQVLQENTEDRDAPASVPVLDQDSAVQAEQASVNARKTKPPKHFTDGTLIGAMANVAKVVDNEELRRMLRETSGLGTEATRASILETLVQRGFVSRSKKNLVSTALGRGLVDALPAPMRDPAMTALWEQSLDDIARDRVPHDEFLQRQITWLRQLVDHVNASQDRYCSSLSTLPPDTRAPKKRRRKNS